MTPGAQALIAKFDEALANDLMVPQALPLLEIALSNKTLATDEKLRVVASMDLALGLDLLNIRRVDLRVRPADAKLTETDIDKLVELRQDARANKDYASSDAIRDSLEKRGVALMDGAGAMRWDWILDI